MSTVIDKNFLDYTGLSTYDEKIKQWALEETGPNVYYGTCTSEAAVTAKAVSVSSNQNYKLATGELIMVLFSAAVPASATLNVNTSGAKSIYYRGSALIANVIKADDLVTFVYDGTYFHIIAIDRNRPSVSFNNTELVVDLT